MKLYSPSSLPVLLVILLVGTRQVYHVSSFHHSASPLSFSKRLQSSLDAERVIHPAVEGWPNKYAGLLEDDTVGPRVLHQDFTVTSASEKDLEELDVKNWPIWTTSDKEKWVVGNQNVDKVMPYSELSYVLSGKLEIVPSDGQPPVIVEPGDFVTFPKGFKASWKVLEELTWHYYLY